MPLDIVPSRPASQGGPQGPPSCVPQGPQGEKDRQDRELGVSPGAVRGLTASSRGPGHTHHDLWEGLQGRLELVGRRQGLGKVHGPGQDEQRRRDLLVQVQLQPLRAGVRDPGSPPAWAPTGPGRTLPCSNLRWGGEGGAGWQQRPQQPEWTPSPERAFPETPLALQGVNRPPHSHPLSTSVP